MKSKISWQKNLFDDQVTVDEKDKHFRKWQMDLFQDADTRMIERAE